MRYIKLPPPLQPSIYAFRRLRANCLFAFETLIWIFDEHRSEACCLMVVGSGEWNKLAWWKLICWLRAVVVIGEQGFSRRDRRRRRTFKILLMLLLNLVVLRFVVAVVSGERSGWRGRGGSVVVKGALVRNKHGKGWAWETRGAIERINRPTSQSQSSDIIRIKHGRISMHTQARRKPELNASIIFCLAHKIWLRGWMRRRRRTFNNERNSDCCCYHFIIGHHSKTHKHTL